MNWFKQYLESILKLQYKIFWRRIWKNQWSWFKQICSRNQFWNFSIISFEEQESEEIQRVLNQCWNFSLIYFEEESDQIIDHGSNIGILNQFWNFSIISFEEEEQSEETIDHDLNKLLLRKQFWNFSVIFFKRKKKCLKYSLILPWHTPEKTLLLYLWILILKAVIHEIK